MGCDGVQVKNMVKAAIFAAFIGICAQIAVPIGAVRFTLQTFAIGLCLLCLGGKWGTVSLLVYLGLGLAGLPVFSGFQGGVSVLFSATGGYLSGFLAWALIFWLLTCLKTPATLSLFIGFILCYCTALLWSGFVYGTDHLWLLIAPYIIPDLLKLAGALLLSRQLKKHI